MDRKSAISIGNTRTLGILMILGLLVVAGCEDKRRHQASEKVEFPTVTPAVGKDASAQDTAIALLNALKHLQEIRSQGFGDPANKEKYDQAMGAIAALMDKDEVYLYVVGNRAPGVPLDMKRDAAVRMTAESWTSAVAHYVDGIDFSSVSTINLPKGRPVSGDSLRLTSGGDIVRERGAAREFEGAIVRIDAENPGERQKLTRIEADPAVAARKTVNPDGVPDQSYVSLVRQKALEQGFNVPLRVSFSFELRQLPEGWRAKALTLDAARTSGPTPAAQPSPEAAPIPAS